MTFGPTTPPPREKVVLEMKNDRLIAEALANSSNQVEFFVLLSLKAVKEVDTQ